MAELGQEPTVVMPPNGGTPPVTETVTVEQLQEQLTATNAMLEAVKKTQSGSDSTVTAQQKELTTLRAEKEDLAKSLKDTMTTEEKTTLELTELREAFNKSEESRISESLYNTKIKLMAAEKIDIGYAEFIHGNSEEELTASIQKFKELRMNDDKVLLSKSFNGQGPVKGSQVPGEKQMKRQEWMNLPDDQKAQAGKDFKIID